MTFTTRLTQPDDLIALWDLYQQVAQFEGGIARKAHEITETYIRHNLTETLRTGVGYVIPHPEQAHQLVAEIHCYALQPSVFQHVLSELTIVVHPQFQGYGLGKQVFSALLHHIQTHRKDVLRVELIARESNAKAIRFYEKLGFRIEGRFEQRIHRPDGGFEADIPMAWFNPEFESAFIV